MAFAIQLADASVNEALDALTAFFDDGYLRIYDGTKPATAATAITTQILLAELRFDNPAFGASSAGVAVANAIADETNAPASGTATWFRVFKSDGTSVVMDGSVGLSNAEIVLTSTAVTIGGTVSVPSFQITAPKS